MIKQIAEDCAPDDAKEILLAARWQVCFASDKQLLLWLKVGTEKQLICDLVYPCRRLRR